MESTVRYNIPDTRSYIEATFEIGEDVTLGELKLAARAAIDKQLQEMGRPLLKPNVVLLYGPDKE